MLMASMVPLTFYAVTVPTPSVQEACRRQLVVGRLSTSLTTICTNVAGPKYSDRSMSTAYRSGVCTISRGLFQPSSSHFSASFSAHVVITGFWVGPDSEDGYGFVQAFLLQT